MQRMASIVRVAAMIVSLLYAVLLLPHIGGIGADHLRSAWFWAGTAVAMLWLPLLLAQGYFASGRSPLRTTLSFVPIAIIVSFLAALFTAAG